MTLIAQVFQLPAEQVSLDSSPETVETWDSLQHLNLVLALEQEFAIQFTPEEIEELISVRAIVAVLDVKNGNKNDGAANAN